jgi:hypothetical protein
MNRLVLAAGLALLPLGGWAMAQVPGDMTGGFQTGVVDTPVDEDQAKIGVDDGSGFIQGQTDIVHKTKKKQKDPNCKWVQQNGYKSKNCW